MIGNRLPRGRTQVSGRPSNRAPETFSTLRAGVIAADAAAKVEAASDNARVEDLASGVPADLNSTIPDFETRIAALEAAASP